MSRPLVKIHDTSSDEVEVREMTDEEYAQYEADAVALAAALAAEEAKAAAKASAEAKLSALGLTAAEVAAILGTSA